MSRSTFGFPDQIDALKQTGCMCISVFIRFHGSRHPAFRDPAGIALQCLSFNRSCICPFFQQCSLGSVNRNHGPPHDTGCIAKYLLRIFRYPVIGKFRSDYGIRPIHIVKIMNSQAACPFRRDNLFFRTGDMRRTRYADCRHRHDQFLAYPSHYGSAQSRYTLLRYGRT